MSTAFRTTGRLNSTEASNHMAAARKPPRCACGSEHHMQGECDECRSKHGPALQRCTWASGTPNFASSSHDDGPRAPGEPFQRATPAPEGQFGHDFSRTPATLPARLPINHPDDAFEQEAIRLADAVLTGGPMPPAALTAPEGRIQRDDTPAPPGPAAGKPPTEEDKYKTAAKKTAEAFLETKAGQQLKSQAEQLGKDFLSSVEGKVIAGAALGGGLAAIIATNKELPIPVPEIPLDFISPGLKAKLTWEGPVRTPTNVSLTLSTQSGVSLGARYTKTDASPGKPAEQTAGLTLTIPLGGSPAKPKSGVSDSEKYRSETERLRADQDTFREGLKPADQRRAEDKEFWDAYWKMTNKKKQPDDLMLMREANDSARSPDAAPPLVHAVLSEPGQPLDAATRAYMETRFGHDFSSVRVHTDAQAAESARAVHARAYTVGGHVVLGAGQLAPRSHDGARLLAHELAHTIQQGAAPALAGNQPRECGPSLVSRAPPILQRYAVPGNLQCNDVVDWLNTNSPFAPEWAATQCTYSFNGQANVRTSTQADGSVKADVRGHNRMTVSVSCPIDRPEWNPSSRPNRAAEVAAWNAMRTQLDAHEASHRTIGQTWRATLESRWRGVNFSVTGTDQADAIANASTELDARKDQWGAEAQAAQDAIDPFRGAVLNCP